MKPWEDAQDLLLPDLKDCPWPMAQSRLVLAAREFFSRSGTWSATLDPIPSQAGVTEYPEVVPSSNMEVVRVRRCFFGTDELTPLTPDEFFSAVMDPTGMPEYMTVDADVLLLSGAPRESGVPIIVEATFKPSLSSTTFPTELWDQYGEGIAEGAKARLYKSPGKPYTDLNMAAVATDAFNVACGKARVRVDRGMTTARTRVRSRFF